MSNPKPTRCDFCGRMASDLGDEKLIVGQGAAVAICGHCISLCQNLVEESSKAKKGKFQLNTKAPKPSDIKDYFDQCIIGQDQAKIIIAVAVCDHYKRILYNNAPVEKNKRKIRLEKSNVLIIGPTGTGKTHFARCISEYLKVPFAIGDATTLTEAGYVGDDVENLLLRLLQAADGDIERAQNGIIFLDEVDKLASTPSNRSTSKDVGGEGVQQALLKMLEGTIAHVPAKGGRKHPEGGIIPFDTTNVLFIGSGAFVSLDEIVKERIEDHGGNNYVGFDCSTTKEKETEKVVNKNIIPEDLVKFGLIPEFIGRFPTIAQLQALDEKALRSIFTEVRDSLYEQYRLQFSLDGVELELTERAINEIIQEAMILKTGARGLRAIAEKMILPYKYRIGEYQDEKICIVDGHSIEGCFSKERERVAS